MPVKGQVNLFFKKLRRVSLFKMDIEGSEKGIMKNITKKTIKKIKQITMEVHDYSKGNIAFITTKLRELGFKTVIRLDKEIYASKLEKGEQYVKTS